MLSDLVIAYLFLGGVGSGTCFVLAFLLLRTPSSALSAVGSSLPSWEFAPLRPSSVYVRLFGRSQAAALVFLMLGSICLAADVGRFDRILLLFLNPAPTVLSIGAWSLAACIVLAAAILFAWYSAFQKMTIFVFRVLALMQVFVAVLVMAYTGLLLGGVAAVPLWHDASLPVLFAASSLSCGFALVCMVGLLGGSGRDFASLIRRLMKADAVVIVIEIVALAILLAHAFRLGESGSTGTEVAASFSVSYLLEGPVSGLFWGVFVGVGIALPLFLELGMMLRRLSLPFVPLAVSACVLVGGFVMRYCFVVSGMHPAIPMM